MQTLLQKSLLNRVINRVIINYNDSNRRLAMRFLIQQKFFTLKDRFFIKDERGYDCYEIADKLVTVGNKFWVNTVDGNNLYFMRQKLFHLMPHYEIYQGEEVVANVRARFRFFRAKVEVQSDRFGDILITGNVMNWDFEIKRGDEMLAVINKHILKVRDTYTLEIMARIDPAFMIALAILVDAMYQRRK